MPIKVNLDEANMEALPNAVYPVTVTGVEIKTSGAGNEYIAWEFTVNDGEFVDRKLWLNTVTTGKGAFRFAEMCQALGVDTEGMEEFEPTDYMGAELKVKTKQVQAQNADKEKQYNPDGTPKMRNEVSQCLVA